MAALSIWGFQRLFKVQFTSPGCRYQIIATFLLLLGALTLVCFTVGIINEVKFNLYGVTAQATVLDRHIETQTDSDGDTSSSYYITYRFVLTTSNADATAMTHKERVTRDVYDALPPGSSVTIRYLPNDPEVSRIGTGPLIKPWIAIIGVMMLGFIGVTFVLAFATFRPVIECWMQSRRI